MLSDIIILLKCCIFSNHHASFMILHQQHKTNSCGRVTKTTQHNLEAAEMMSHPSKDLLLESTRNHQGTRLIYRKNSTTGLVFASFITMGTSDRALQRRSKKTFSESVQMFSALSSLYHAIYKANVDVLLSSLLKNGKNEQRISVCRLSAHCDTENESDLAPWMRIFFFTDTSWESLTF